jgi:hypothetical protein
VGVGGGTDVSPFGAQRLDDGGQHEALDVGAGGELRAELMAFRWVQRPLEEGAEDGGFDRLPVELRRLMQARDLVGVQVQRGGVGEEAAVEALEGVAQDDRDAAGGAGVHLAEELLGQRLELRGVGADRIEQVGEAGGRQEAHVLGEHAEEAATEEIGHPARGVAGLFEGLGELGQQIGDLAGDHGGVPRRIEGERVRPDQAEALADFRPAQVVQADAESLGMGEMEVVAAGLGEVGEDLDTAAHVHGQQEGGIRVAGGQRADVALGLAAGFEHGVVPRARAANRGGLALPGNRAGGFERQVELARRGGLILKLLGFEEESGAFVEVNAPLAG